VPSTSIGLVIRQQAWFRAHVAPDGLPPFSSKNANALSPLPVGSFRARVLIGRGPVEHELTPEVLFWFEHGEQEYPTFQCPSIGPSGAGLKVSSRPRKILATEQDVLCLIEISVVQPVGPEFERQFEESSAGDASDTSGGTVKKWQEEALAWLERAIGLYALYQYPIVWEPLGVHPLVGFVNIAQKTFRASTRIEPDNFIPFRPNVATKVTGTELADHGLIDLSKLAGGVLHLPLVLLQRSLWHRNIELRFLETFLILDYLTGQREIEDSKKADREELFKVLDTFIRATHPQFIDRLNGLKHVVLQAPLRERLTAYLQRIGLNPSAESLHRMLRARNDLAHARQIDRTELMAIELEARHLVREALRRELAQRGIAYAPPLAASE
jgi:hypothetical protein